MKLLKKNQLLTDSNYSCSELIELIKSKVNQTDSVISIRVSMILEELISERLEKNKQIEFFDLIVSLISISDRDPAFIIADLLSLINPENHQYLENNTILKASFFLKENLKSESVKYL